MLYLFRYILYAFFTNSRLGFFSVHPIDANLAPYVVQHRIAYCESEQITIFLLLSISSFRISFTSIIAFNSAVLLLCFPLKVRDTFLGSFSEKYTPIPALAFGFPLCIQDPSVYTYIIVLSLSLVFFVICFFLFHGLYLF